MYTATSWVAGTTALSQSHMNNLETQYTQATQSFNEDLFAGFVLYGMVATKDNSTANQLDVTAGVAYLLQSDGTTYRTAPTSSTQSTSAISSTYYLYLQPAGTFYWATTNTPAANSLFICQVATDGSGNILTVTDKRNLYASVIPNSAGAFAFGLPTNGGMSIDVLGTAVGIGVVAPGAPTATPVSGSNLGVGVYGYKVTYVSFSGESALGSAGTCTTTSVNKAVNLSVIPTGPTGTLKRNIYRTAVGGSTYKLLTTIADNTTTTYADTTADGSLGANAPTHPTMGADLWKSNSSTLLAAIYADGAMYFDSGSIASDGAGNLAVAGQFNWSQGSIGAGNTNIMSVNPSGASTNNTWYLLYLGATGWLDFFDNTNSKDVLQLAPNTGGIAIPNGPISKIGGQVSTGSFGVPVTIDETIAQHVGSTSTTNIVNITTPALGLYRMSGYVWMGNGSNANIAVTFSYTDGSTSTSTFSTALANNGVVMNGSNSFTTSNPYVILPLTVYAAASTGMTVSFHDPSGTPNDYVSILLERLA